MTTFNHPRKNKKTPNWNPKHGTWYVSVKDDTSNILHKDLSIKQGTYYGGQYTGYYKTRKLAWEAIKAYKEKNA